MGLSRKQRVAAECRLATDIVASERAAMTTGPAPTTLAAASMALGLVSGVTVLPRVGPLLVVGYPGHP